MVALDAETGSTVWTGRVGGLGYTTPAVSGGRVFVGGFDGRIRALRATSGSELWSTQLEGRILGAPVLIGENVFVSTLEKRTYAVRASDGKIVWRLPLGKYSPGIATEQDLLLLAERTALGYPRTGRSASVVTGGWRRRQSGERCVGGDSGVPGAQSGAVAREGELLAPA